MTSRLAEDPIEVTWWTSGWRGDLKKHSKVLSLSRAAKFVEDREADVVRMADHGVVTFIGDSTTGQRARVYARRVDDVAPFYETNLEENRRYEVAVDGEVLRRGYRHEEHTYKAIKAATRGSWSSRPDFLRAYAQATARAGRADRADR